MLGSGGFLAVQRKYLSSPSEFVTMRLLDVTAGLVVLVCGELSKAADQRGWGQQLQGVHLQSSLQTL